jgi:general secretion pathway protein F
MRFRAKVLATDMTVEFIELEASDMHEAARVAESSGVRILDIHARRGSWLTRSRQQRFNLAVFNQQLYALLDAGQPIVDTIEVLGRKDRKGKHRAIYDTLLQSLKQGRQLSDSMEALPSVFPALYVAMVRSSETTGTVRKSINRFMFYQAQVGEIRSKLIGAAIYPAILLSVGFLVISFLMLYVLPRFSEVFEDASARAQQSAGFVAWWGGFVRDNTLLAWLGFFVLIATAIAAAANHRFRQFFARKMEQAPMIGEIIWTLQMARMYRTLGMLLHSGVGVLTAMRMTQATLPASMSEDLGRAIGNVSEGKPMSETMADCGLSTEVAQRLLAAGESSGKLDEMMERIADFYDQEMRSWIDTASRVVEPLLMVALGLVIGVIVLMLYAPIFDLANAF